MSYTYYNPMEMPFSSQLKTEEEPCDGLGCDGTGSNGTTDYSGYIESSGTFLSGLSDVLGVFYGNQQQPIAGTMPQQPQQPQQSNNNTMIIVVVSIILIALITLGIVLAVRANRK